MTEQEVRRQAASDLRRSFDALCRDIDHCEELGMDVRFEMVSGCPVVNSLLISYTPEDVEEY